MASAHTNESHTRDNIGYLFDDAGKRAETRFRNLSALHDARTMHHLNQRDIEEGWSCLEVGGSGSITSWLCARVGFTGRVLAADTEARFLRALSFPNLEVWPHDFRQELLPVREFALVHVRLPLIHLPEWESALRRMVAALRPGGWIMVEESDEMSLLPDLAVNPGALSPRVRHPFQQVVTSARVDMRHGRLLPQKLQSNGLVNIGAETSVFVWKARSAGTRLLKLNCQELREATGWRLMPQNEFEADMNRVDEQDFFTLSQRLWTAWGQLPDVAESRSWWAAGMAG